jgi:predicted P-loop ATPase
MTSVTDYLGALIWDGVPRIDRWLIDYAAAEDSSYVRAASRAMLVAAVRRARLPGCKCDQMPVLEGPQGCGKSAALRLLAVKGEWFSDVPLTDSDTRRIIEATQGKWIVEASELTQLLERAADDEEMRKIAPERRPTLDLKAFLSRTHDEARMAYAREVSRVPRPFVMVGTTSVSPYLADAAGARRIWPIRVGYFDLPRLAGIRDQLWAEAAIAEAGGESIDLAGAVASA